MAYAFKVSRVNPDFISFKVWILGYYSKVCSIAVSSLPKIVAQIDTALADGDCDFEIGGIRFSADEKLLKSIRKELSSYCYCCEGASDANHVPVNPPREVATESVKKCGAKPKASAPACKPSARQLSGIKNEELRMKNWGGKPPSTPAGVADCCSREGDGKTAVKECCSCGDDNNAAIHSSFSILNSSLREALRAELVPIRETLDELSFKVEEMAIFAKGNSALPLPESSFPRTKRGRTSVVVGVRKISTTKKQR